MRQSAHPRWRGFERSPAGRLLEQVVDLDREMGVAYERSVGFFKDFHRHDRLMLVCPRGACVMRLSARRPARTLQIDSSDVLLVPAGWEHDDEGVSVVYDTFALYPSQRLLEDAAARTGVALPALDAPRRTGRSRWFREVLDQYFTARVLERQIDGERLQFLEHELIAEIVRSLAAPSPIDVIEGGVAERALRQLEASLFGAISLDELGRSVGASVPTLLRHFRRAYGVSPFAYVKQRRLDEAMRLLKEGRLSVSEIAVLVGYDEPAAFSKAFRARFGKPPRSFLGA